MSLKTEHLTFRFISKLVAIEFGGLDKLLPFYWGLKPT